MKEEGRCEVEYHQMLHSLGGVEVYGDDTPLPIGKILDVCGLETTLWALRIVIEPAEKQIRLLACEFIRHVHHLFEEMNNGYIKGYLAGLAAGKESGYDAAEIAWQTCEAAAAKAVHDAARDSGEYDKMEAGRGAAKAAAAARKAEKSWQSEQLYKLLRLEGGGY